MAAGSNLLVPELSDVIDSLMKEGKLKKTKTVDWHKRANILAKFLNDALLGENNNAKLYFNRASRYYRNNTLRKWRRK